MYKLYSVSTGSKLTIEVEYCIIISSQTCEVQATAEVSANLLLSNKQLLFKQIVL